MPLMPKRVKYRKQTKGSRKGFATSGASLAYGDYGVKALTRGWLKATQIACGRPHGSLRCLCRGWCHRSG